MRFALLRKDGLNSSRSAECRSAARHMNPAGNGRSMSHPLRGRAFVRWGHIGMVISGQAACAMEDGRSYVMKPGDIFYIGPGHDSWVVGDQPYVSLHFLGAEKYAHDWDGGSPFEIRHVSATASLNLLERAFQIVD